MKRRVVITGIGVISALGHTIDRFWENCLAGESLVEPIPERWRDFATFHSGIWSPLPTVDHRAFGLTRPELLRHDPVALNALCAARQALENAGLVLTETREHRNGFTVGSLDPDRAGVFMGTSIGGAHTFIVNTSHQMLARPRQALAELAASGGLSDTAAQRLQTIIEQWTLPLRVNPMVVPMIMPNTVSAALGIKFHLTAANNTYTCACAAATVAIGHAFKAIQRGDIDFALTGGSEYMDDDYGCLFIGFDIAKTLVRDYVNPECANRPFDQNRSGFLFSQGASAVLVLEEYENARQRGAPIIAEIAGFAETFDAHNMLSIEPEGRQIKVMIGAALADAGVTARDIQYINTHGTGTKVNDAIEAMVIEQVFGNAVLVNSTKSLLGHTIGASGALEAAVTALSLRHQTTHICRNLEDPIADLNFARAVEPRTMSYAFSQSFAFGGSNAGLVLKAYDP